jgi:hypothetical protein
MAENKAMLNQGIEQPLQFTVRSTETLQDESS